MQVRKLSWRWRLSREFASKSSRSWRNVDPPAASSRHCYGGTKMTTKHLQGALDLLEQHRVEMGPSTYVSLLRQCSTREDVRMIHEHLARKGKVGMVDCLLLEMYCKVGSIPDACRVFDGLQQSSKKRAFPWNILLGAYCKHDFAHEAMRLLSEMERYGVEPDRITFVASLGACSQLRDLEAGKAIHNRIISGGFQSPVLDTALLTMYGKCGSVQQAREVFEKLDKVEKQCGTCWNAIIAAYAQNGHSAEALQLYHRMVPEGVKPNRITFMTVLTTFGEPADLDQGRAVHDQIIDCGLEGEVTIGNSLISMYGRCRSQEEARQVFEDMPRRDVVSWNAIIAAYVQGGYSEEAWDMYKRMNLAPDYVTFTCVLGAFNTPQQLPHGKEVHARIAASRIRNVVLETALLNMYRKCGSLDDARAVFDKMQATNIVSWNTMIAGYVQHGDEQGAMELFEKLKSTRNVPDSITFLSLLQVSSSLERVREIHSHILDLQESDIHVQNGLITAYSRVSENVEEALAVFERMKVKNVVTWTAIIGALVEHGRGRKALHLYKSMILEGIRPDSVACLGALDACTSIGSLTEGRKIHSYVESSMLHTDIFVGSALVNLYGKCGDVIQARSVFDEMQARSATTWNCMIGAYAQHGHAQKSLDLYESMGLDGTRPDAITFLCILFACSHIGQMDKARDYFVSMEEDYEIEAETSHYCCILDLLSRGGWTHMAEDLISSMPVQPDRIAWTTLLGASNNQEDIQRAIAAALQVPHTSYRNMLPNLQSGGCLKTSVRAARRLSR